MSGANTEPEGSGRRWWEVRGGQEPDADEGRYGDLVTGGRGRNRPDRSLAVGADPADESRHPMHRFLWPIVSVVTAGALIVGGVYGIPKLLSQPASEVTPPATVTPGNPQSNEPFIPLPPPPLGFPPGGGAVPPGGGGGGAPGRSGGEPNGPGGNPENQGNQPTGTPTPDPTTTPSPSPSTTPDTTTTSTSAPSETSEVPPETTTEIPPETTEIPSEVSELIPGRVPVG